MSNKQYDALVYIGRFQPFHLGHKSIIDRALELADRVIIVIGSSNSSRSTRNPFTHQDRVAMIRACYPNHVNEIQFAHVQDYPYKDSKWISTIQEKVRRRVGSKGSDAKIGLIGHNKDHSSFYLKMFPQWKSEPAPNYKGIDATTIRETLFRARNNGVIDGWSDDVPKEVVSWILFWIKENPAIYKQIVDEYQFVSEYKQLWSAAPYPPIFSTVDSIVCQSGHVLMIKRKFAPGKGLWALPGGYVDPNETLLESAIRELREETKIKVPAPVLKGSVVSQHTFDDPHRSQRGRVISTGFYIELPPAKTLPRVAGGDDAAKAKWIPLNDIHPAACFEDHYSIIDYFLDPSPFSTSRTAVEAFL